MKYTNTQVRKQLTYMNSMTYLGHAWVSKSHFKIGKPGVNEVFLLMLNCNDEYSEPLAWSTLEHDMNVLKHKYQLDHLAKKVKPSQVFDDSFKLEIVQKDATYLIREFGFATEFLIPLYLYHNLGNIIPRVPRDDDFGIDVKKEEVEDEEFETPKLNLIKKKTKTEEN